MYSKQNTILGTLSGITSGIVSAARRALDLIDLSEHSGGHPRKGTVDLIPIHPISNLTTLADCGQVALNIGSQLKATHPKLSIFYFGHADIPENRDLVQRRKEIGWFQNGPFSSTHGISGIGAIPYMSNFNVMIKCSDLDIGQRIAKSLRQRSGGLLGVQSMAFPHGDNQIEIACNVDLVLFDDKDEKQVNAKAQGKFVKSFGDYYMTPFEVIHKEITDKAKEFNCHVIGDSVIIGFTPKEAFELTTKAMAENDSWLVGKINRNIQM